jgi:LacI family transcriptional regulator
MITDDDPELEYRQLQALCQARATGVAIALTAAPLPETLALLNLMPAVQVVRSHAGLELDAVVVDDREAMRVAMAHLLANGHRRIAYLGISRLHSVGAQRWAGVCDALAEDGLSDDAITADFTGPHSDLPTDLLGKLMAAAPSALLLGGTSFTIPALAWVQEKGLRLPQDLSLICCGDAEWLPYVGPGLTTISLGVGETAAACASLLIDRVRGEARKPPAARQPAFISISPTLVVRGSSGPALRP